MKALLLTIPAHGPTRDSHLPSEGRAASATLPPQTQQRDQGSLTELLASLLGPGGGTERLAPRSRLSPASALRDAGQRELGSAGPTPSPRRARPLCSPMFPSSTSLGHDLDPTSSPGT